MALSPKSSFVRDQFTWLAYLMLAYYAYSQTIIGPLMPFLRAELNLSYTVTGLHLSAFALGMVLAGLSGDRLAQRYGRRVIFWSGATGMAGGAIALILSGQVVMTLTSALLMGYLGSLSLVMVQTTLSDRHGEQRAIALTESNVGASLSSSLAPLLVGLFQSTQIGWRGALSLAVVSLALMALRYFRVAIPEAQPAAARPVTLGRGLPLTFWAYWLVVFLGVSVEWCLIFWSADFLEKVVGLSRVTAATMMGVFLGAMLVGRFVGSRLSRRIPTGLLLLGALGMAMVGFLVLWLARLAPLNIAGLFVAGLGVANLFPLSLTTTISVAPHLVDQASARVSLAGGLAILISPFILGWLADQLNIQIVLGIIGLLLLVATMVTYLANRLAAQQNQRLSASLSPLGVLEPGGK
jgi:MFS family permease